MATEYKGYSGIFKSTLLFSIVEVIRMLVAVVKNKLVSILLGPEGMGIISVFNTTINFVKTGTGLGLAQSAVRDVSEAKGSGERDRFSQIITVTNRLVVFTSCLGLLVTVLASPLLSKWGFGSFDYTLSFILLGLAVAFTIYVDNQLAILKGMRQLRSLAKCSIIGSVVSLVTGVPMFYFWGNDGIVPSLIISAFSALLVSQYFVNKIDYDRIKISVKDVFQLGGPMLKMGCALMMINLLGYFSDLIVLGFIRKMGGLADIGIYQAGSTIVTSYFGIVLTAMTTDYYPRISAINADNEALRKEVNMQTEMGLLLMAPLAALFCAIAPFIIRLLYTSAFVSVTIYTDIAIMGVILSSSSNCIAMILLAKQDTRSFLTISFTLRIAFTILFIFLYKYWQLEGLGIGYVVSIVFQMLVYMWVMWRKYNITFTPLNHLLNICIPLASLIAVLLRHIPSEPIKYISLIIWASILSVFSLYRLNKLNVDILAILKLKKK